MLRLPTVIAASLRLLQIPVRRLRRRRSPRLAQRRRRRRRRRRRHGASARPPELLSLLRVEHGDHVPARGTAPAHLEPRAYAPGVENVRAGRDARVSSSLDRFATHGTAHRGFTSVADQRNPIVVAGDTPRKRRDRGVGRRARRIVARERIVSRERRSRRRVALGVEAAIVRVVARSRPPSPRSVLEPPSALARAAAAPTPAPVAVDGDAGVERLAPCAAAAVQ